MFTDAVRCEGTNTLVRVDDQHTDVVLDGQLDIDLKEIPGVPRLMAGRMRPQVERFIISLITPNLKETNAAMGRMLDARAR